MLYSAVTDAQGQVVASLAASLPSELAAIEAGVALADGETIRPAPGLLRAARHWWDGSAWAERPVPPAPPALTAGVEAVWSGLSAGAVVTVDPLNGAAPVSGEATDGTLALTLPAGPWRLSVNEVFPALAASFDIEVAEA